MLHEVKTMINRAKMFIQKTDKATKQHFTWIAVSSFILFYRSRDNMQLKTAQLTFSTVFNLQRRRHAVAKVK